MNSIILQIAARYLRFLFLTFALLALLRGHNQPGGGFIGGLLASLSYIFTALAYSGVFRQKHRLLAERFLAFGLLFIFVSIIPSIFFGDQLMSGHWWSIDLPLSLNLKLGTPFVFDIGVFLTVLGVSLLFFYTLSTKK